MKHYTIVISIRLRKEFHHVYCAENELPTIANSLWMYHRYVLHEDSIACVAKEGDWDGEGMHDFLFQDCM